MSKILTLNLPILLKIAIHNTLEIFEVMVLDAPLNNAEHDLTDK
jgi:hypothetical protein